MSRGAYRAVYSVLLDDPGFRKLPAQARRVFLVLKTTRLNNIANLFLCDEGGLVTIAAQTGLLLKSVKKAIEILSDRNWVSYQPPLLWIRNGLKHDPLYIESNENHKKAVMKVLAGLPKSSLVVKFCKYYELELPLGYHPEAFQNTPEIPRAITDSDSETETDNRFPNPDSNKDTDSEIISSGKPDNVNDDIPYSEIIEHLNETIGSSHKASTRKNRELVKASWNEGFRLEDFQIVHIRKAGAWLHTDMAKYLRPVTLYGTKFESYLNEIPADNRFSQTTARNLKALYEWLQEKEREDLSE